MISGRVLFRVSSWLRATKTVRTPTLQELGVQHTTCRCNTHADAAMQTFDEVDLAGDGVISLEEWRTMVLSSPDVIGYMTLPVLKEVRGTSLHLACVRAECARIGLLVVWAEVALIYPALLAIAMHQSDVPAVLDASPCALQLPAATYKAPAKCIFALPAGCWEAGVAAERVGERAFHVLTSHQ